MYIRCRIENSRTIVLQSDPSADIRLETTYKPSQFGTWLQDVQVLDDTSSTPLSFDDEACMVQTTECANFKHPISSVVDKSRRAIAVYTGASHEM